MQRKLRITGKGHLAVAPDIIILAFSADAQEWEYEKAITALNQKVNGLRGVLEQEGIDRKSLKTKDFRVRKETKWNKKTEKSDFNGFKASHSLELELPLEKNLINRLLNQIARDLTSIDFSIAFGVKDASQAQQDLLMKAVAKAQENALTLTRATGVSLQEVLDIDYSFREMVIRSESHDYPLYETQVMYESSSANVDYEPDDIKVTETVTITWRIE